MSFEVPIVPLHIHERVSPRNIISIVQKRRGHQRRLFDEADFPLDKRVDFYKHEMDWANRLILGDSLLVMNSLLTKELMAGKVQMIYVDPPYGISYNSNFQSIISNRQVKDGHDESLTREPEQIKAYRDTWELGIHSWLTYLRDRLLLCRELLSDTGSVFVQINHENLHYARCIVEEVFGRDNFCGIIAFRKTGGLQAKYLPSIFDYLIWYSKDKERATFHHLFYKKHPGEPGATQYRYVFGPDGNPKELSQSEIASASPDKLFTHGDLTSQGNPIFEFEFKGKKYRGGYKTTAEGLARLAKSGRILAMGNTLRYVRYLKDSPYSEINQLWEDTGISGFEEEKKYVVQTSPDVIERCILMTTDPGDLVFDPTCGSGTTALAAEKRGRRWIVCDTSRVAFSITRQRLMTALYPYFILAAPEEGLKSGFQYETTSRVTLRSIARDEPAETEILYDRPKVDNTVIRVSGPLTVEAIPAPSIYVEEATEGTHAGGTTEEYISILIESIRKGGIVFPQGKKLKLEGIGPIASSGFLHAEGTVSNGERKRVAISFGPRYGPLGARQTEESIRAATINGYSVLILAGFQIDPAAQSFIQRTATKIEVQFAHINPEIEIHDLLKQTQGSQLFSVFGEPDIELRRSGTGERNVVKLLGVDIYDPITGNTEQTSGDAIPAWFLDEDYDGYSFNICQAFFPDGAMGKNPWDKLENALHGIIDKEKVEQLKSSESLPFELGEHKTIAVKVFDNRGNEVIKIRKLQGSETV